MIHKIINHMFLLQKTKQLSINFTTTNDSSFYNGAGRSGERNIPVFKTGQPVGDGIGPMVVGKMMLNSLKKSFHFKQHF